MLLFHLKEALIIFRRATLASIIAVFTTTIAVFLITLSVVFLFLSDKIDAKLKREIEINVFLDKDITESDLKALSENFRANDLLGTAKFVSDEEAVEKFIRDTGVDFRSVLEVNPLPASYVLTLKPPFVREINLRNTINLYTGFSGVDEVKCDFELAIAILNFLDSGRLLVYIITGVLVFIALYFVISTHKLWMISRQKIFNTMKLVGAKLTTIKSPIILNGIIIGLISGLICSTIVYFLVEILQNYYNLNTLGNYKYLLIFITLISILLGFLSSLLSVRNITLKIDRN